MIKFRLINFLTFKYVHLENLFVIKIQSMDPESFNIFNTLFIFSFHYYDVRVCSACSNTNLDLI